MARLHTPFALAALLMACSASATAQKEPVWTARHITFKHPGGFTQAQLEDAAGLHPGARVNGDALSAAAQKLSETGYFDNVGAQLAGVAADMTVVFDLKPVDRAQMLHVGFENFVWLTHAEVEAAIAPKVPLFCDFLPENSPAAAVIDAALKSALSAKGVTADVSHDTEEPTLQHPERTLEFRVERPGVRVANVKLGGVTPALVPLVQKSVNAAAKFAYNDGLSGALITDVILEPLLDAGYAAATLVGVTVTPDAPADGKVGVIVAGTLVPGDVYKVASITFAGTPLVSLETFAKTQTLHAGELASRRALLETLAPIDAAYRRQGYMDVVVASAPALDRNAKTVAYTVTVVPGEQYRIHTVSTDGLDPKAKADFATGFRMKEGDLYNPEYVAGFMKDNTALRGFLGYTGTWKAYADPNAHTVDLVVTFFKGGRTNEVTVH